MAQSNYRLPTFKVAGAAVIASTTAMLDALPAAAVSATTGGFAGRSFTVWGPTSKQKALVETEMPMAQSVRSVLSVSVAKCLECSGNNPTYADRSGANWQKMPALPSLRQAIFGRHTVRNGASQLLRCHQAGFHLRDDRFVRRTTILISLLASTAAAKGLRQ